VCDSSSRSSSSSSSSWSASRHSVTAAYETTTTGEIKVDAHVQSNDSLHGHACSTSMPCEESSTDLGLSCRTISHRRRFTPLTILQPLNNFPSITTPPFPHLFLLMTFIHRNMVETVNKIKTAQKRQTHHIDQYKYATAKPVTR